MPLPRSTDELALGGVSTNASTQHETAGTNETDDSPLTAPPSASHAASTGDTGAAAIAAQMGEGLAAPTTGRRRQALEQMMEPPSKVVDRGAGIGAGPSDIGDVTARGPGAGDTRLAAQPDLEFARVGGAVIALLLVVFLLRMLAKLPWAEKSEESVTRKGEGSKHTWASTHGLAGTRLPLARTAVRLARAAWGSTRRLLGLGATARSVGGGGAGGGAGRDAGPGGGARGRDAIESAESGTVGEGTEMECVATYQAAPSGPKLLGSTSDPPSVLSQQQLQLLWRALPPRIRIRDWSLLYSTEQHGCSLRTALHRCERQGPTVLLVLDGQGHIFGVFCSESWRQSDLKHYGGNGETFLFKVHPEFSVYKWTRANDHFMLVAHDFVAFGSGEGATGAGAAGAGGPAGFGGAGIYLDSSFEYGSSKRSLTFDNEPLGGSDDFKAIKVEVWGFD